MGGAAVASEPDDGTGKEAEGALRWQGSDFTPVRRSAHVVGNEQGRAKDMDALTMAPVERRQRPPPPAGHGRRGGNPSQWARPSFRVGRRGWTAMLCSRVDGCG